MALALLFADGFDYYNSLALNWDAPGTDTAIDLTGTKSRTGLGCCQITSAAFGPKKILSTNFTTLLCTGALNPGGVVAQGEIFEVSNGGGGPFVRMFYFADGSLGFTLNNGAVLFQTGPGLWQFQAYNFVAMRLTVGVAGHVKFWLNGQVVIDVDANLHGGTPDVVNTVQLMVTGTATGHWDDVAIWSCATNDDFPYAPSIYPAMPSADSAPLQWTPRTGVTHFPMVDAIPENTANYVSDATPGQIDQYIHSIPVNQQVPPVPASVQILAVQHGLLSEIDAAGVRTIASNLNGVQGPDTFALTTSFLYYNEPYTPGLASYAALATTPFGPEVVT